MLRTSSYTSYLDLPGNQDEMLLVHTYTGALRSLEAGRPPSRGTVSR
jgi:hypothetical protein